MSDQDVLVAIRTALAAGCGLLVQWIYGAYLDSRSDAGVGLSAFAKRWIAIGLEVAVPTLLYVVLVLVADEPYRVLQNIAYVGTAFLAGQAGHSVRLPKA